MRQKPVRAERTWEMLVMGPADHRGSPIRSLSDKWFELLLVTVILAVTMLAHFALRATRSLGSGTVTVTASLGVKRSKLSTAVSVRPPVAYLTSLQAGRNWWFQP